MNAAQTIEPMHSTPDRVLSGIAANKFYVHHGALHSGIPVTCSIGLRQSSDLPEIVLLGVEEQLARSIIATVASKLWEGMIELPFSRLREKDIIKGGQVDLLMLGVAQVSALAAFLRDLNVDCIEDAILVQVPDKEGHLPCNMACDPEFTRIQDPENLKFELRSV
jgi:hypothetical protein